MSLPTPYYDRDGITIYCADCRDVLPHLPPVDLVLTDPPYGLADGVAWRRQGGKVIANESGDGHNVLVDNWRASISLTSNAAVVEWCNGNLAAMDDVRNGHRDVGWVEWRLYMFVKTAPGATPRPTMVPSWESALISYVGKRPWYGGGYVPDSWIGLSPNRLGVGVHPTQKPIEPMRNLIQAMSPPDSVILDPFMGSGTTLRAAMDLGRKSIGIEVEERYCEIAVKRLQQSVMRLETA